MPSTPSACVPGATRTALPRYTLGRARVSGRLHPDDGRERAAVDPLEAAATEAVDEAVLAGFPPVTEGVTILIRDVEDG